MDVVIPINMCSGKFSFQGNRVGKNLFHFGNLRLLYQTLFCFNFTRNVYEYPFTVVLILILQILENDIKYNLYFQRFFYVKTLCLNHRSFEFRIHLDSRKMPTDSS